MKTCAYCNKPLEGRGRKKYHGDKSEKYTCAWEANRILMAAALKMRGNRKPAPQSNLKSGEAKEKAKRRAELIRLGYCLVGDDSWLGG